MSRSSATSRRPVTDRLFRVTGSVLLPFLAALDVAINVLVVREYRQLRSAPG